MKFSEMNTYQKVLYVVSIFDVVTGVFGAIFGAIMLFGSATGTATADVNGTSVSVGGLGIFTLIAGILNIAIGIIGIRAAKDISKIKPAYTFAMIGLVYNVIRIVGALFTKQPVGSSLTSTVIAALTFYAALKIKQQFETTSNKQ